MSKYEKSEKAARRGYEIARAHGLREEMIHGLASIDEARRMQQQPYLPGIRATASSGLRYVPLLFKFLVDLRRIHGLIRHAEQEVDPFLRDSLWHVGLEHKIRLFGTLQGIIQSLLGRRLAGILFGGAWESIQRDSFSVGYAAGVANGLKYQDRTRTPARAPPVKGLGPTEIVSSTQVYEFMNHRTGLALVLRDRADSLVRVIVRGHLVYSNAVWSLHAKARTRPLNLRAF
ncbi:MAG TPA: hypothetical protein VGQ24_06060 [Gemmatimonadales bacterium]|nr:hypothetical protein [Gemmatimonadales bacterium]